MTVSNTSVVIDYDAIAQESGNRASVDPEYAAVLRDTEERFALVDSLVATRKAQGLSQKDVAERMGVKQPTVSGFENEGSDPRLSTIQRYARALNCRVKIWHSAPKSSSTDHWLEIQDPMSSYAEEGSVTHVSFSGSSRGQLMLRGTA